MTVANSSIYARIKAVAANARSAKAITNRAFKRDTLCDARDKVIAKLVANRDYFNGVTKDGVDCVYKAQADGTYAIGVKYGNRYLQDIIEGRAFAEGIAKDEVAAVLDALADSVAAGECDAAIEAIMRDNINARAKKVH